jgi:hypothetical protein
MWKIIQQTQVGFKWSIFSVTSCNASSFGTIAVLRNATTISQRIAVRVQVNYHPSTLFLPLTIWPGQYNESPKRKTPIDPI